MKRLPIAMNKKISLHMAQIESDMLERLVEERNQTSWQVCTKSQIIRELILREFINKFELDLMEKGINIENFNEVLCNLEKIGVNNIGETEL